MFTFKTTKPEGPHKSFHPSQHDIKIKKKIVGYIADAEPFTIHLMVIKKDIMENGNPNCDWKWISLKKESTSLQEAKDFLQENFDPITIRFNLYRMEP